jgi:hypothetical protein
MCASDHEGGVHLYQQWQIGGEHVRPRPQQRKYNHFEETDLVLRSGRPAAAAEPDERTFIHTARRTASLDDYINNAANFIIDACVPLQPQHFCKISLTSAVIWPVTFIKQIHDYESCFV